METLTRVRQASPPAPGSPRTARRRLPDPADRLLRRVRRQPAAHACSAASSRSSRRSRRAPAARSSPCATSFGWFGDTFARQGASATSCRRERDELRASRSPATRPRCSENAAAAATCSRSTSRTASTRYDTPVTARVIGRIADALVLDTITGRHGHAATACASTQPVIADGGPRRPRHAVVAPASSIVTLITDPSSSVVGAGARRGRRHGDRCKPSVGDPLDLLVQLAAARRPRSDVGDLVVTGRLRSSDTLRVARTRRASRSAASRRRSESELRDDQQVHVAPFADLRHLDFVAGADRARTAATASARRCRRDRPTSSSPLRLAALGFVDRRRADRGGLADHDLRRQRRPHAARRRVGRAAGRLAAGRGASASPSGCSSTSRSCRRSA